MQLGSETFELVLHHLRTIRNELAATVGESEALEVSKCSGNVEKWLNEAEQRETTYRPFATYCDEFRARHIQPLIEALPTDAVWLVEDEFLSWLAERAPDDSTADPIEAELTDVVEALAVAVEDCNSGAACYAARVIQPLVLHLESRRLKRGQYVALGRAAEGERELAERIIPLAYEAVTGRTIKLRRDTVGGYVRVGSDYEDCPAWFGVCDSIQAASESSSVLAAVFNSSLTVPSRWAAARIKLYVDGELQPYTTDEYPWCLEILDERSVDDDEGGAQKILICKSTQVGISVCLFVRALWEVDYRGRTCVYFVPDESAVRKLNIRFENLIEGSQYLADRVEQTTEAKRIGMATLHLEGSRGISAAVSQPADVIILDERDRFDPASAEEIARRISGAKHGLLIEASTPSFPGVGIDASIQRYGDAAESFHAPCPFCQESVCLTYPEAFDNGGAEYEADPKCADAFVRCPKCSHRLDRKTKAAMLAQGKWTLADPANRARGVRVFVGLNHLYSSTVSAEDFCKESLKSGEEAVAEFYRSDLGQPFIHERGQVAMQALVDSVSVKYSMAAPKYPVGLELRGHPRWLVVDQGRPHTVIVVEMRRVQKQEYHDSFRDAFKFRVLWLEKVATDNKKRLNQIAHDWGCWSAVMDIDPNPDLPKFLIHGPDKHLYHGGHVAAIRAIETTANAEKEIDILSEDGARLLYANIDRSLFYARAIDRLNNGSVSFPNDTPKGYFDELQGAVKTHRVDQHGQVKQYVRKKDPNRAMDTLSCMQLAEVALDLWLENKIGVITWASDKIA